LLVELFLGANCTPRSRVFSSIPTHDSITPYEFSLPLRWFFSGKFIEDKIGFPWPPQIATAFLPPFQEIRRNLFGVPLSFLSPVSVRRNRDLFPIPTPITPLPFRFHFIFFLLFFEEHPFSPLESHIGIAFFYGMPQLRFPSSAFSLRSFISTVCFLL